jgi:hypothetical protein
MPQLAIDFDGSTYEAALDRERLSSQLRKVRALMGDLREHTLDELAAHAQCTVASASARIRDLRKPRYGGYVVHRRRIGKGVFGYRLGAWSEE